MTTTAVCATRSRFQESHIGSASPAGVAPRQSKLAGQGAASVESVFSLMINTLGPERYLGVFALTASMDNMLTIPVYCSRCGTHFDCPLGYLEIRSPFSDRCTRRAEVNPPRLGKPSHVCIGCSPPAPTYRIEIQELKPMETPSLWIIDKLWEISGKDIDEPYHKQPGSWSWYKN